MARAGLCSAPVPRGIRPNHVHALEPALLDRRFAIISATSATMMRMVLSPGIPPGWIIRIRPRIIRGVMPILGGGAAAENQSRFPNPDVP